ncbi:MAG: ABC transporter permease [Chloroflexi bacterium]|nr:ABC transporter permease [Chloroflexota bacterium]
MATYVREQVHRPPVRSASWREANAIGAIAFRDFLKLLRDPARIVSTFVFPLIFIGILGGSLQANIGAAAGYNILVFTFTGVLAQTVYQSTTTGIISLMDDRENDFSQEIFVSPISRYSIIFGKILGETLVALPQGVAILLFALVIGVPLSWAQVGGLVVAGFITALYGGAFGVILLATVTSRRAADQIFPFLLLPQYFTAGIFAPIKVLPPYLEILSLLSPMRYAVDFTRGLFYWGQPAYNLIVLTSPLVNLAVITVTFVVFMAIGTFLFVRSERNR